MSEEKLIAFGYQKTSDGDESGGAKWDEKTVVTLDKGVLSINKFGSKDTWDAESYSRYLDTGEVIGKDGMVARMTNPLDIPVSDLGEIKFERFENEGHNNQIVFKYRKKSVWTYIMNIFPERVNFDEDQMDSFMQIHQALIGIRDQMNVVAGNTKRPSVSQNGSNSDTVQSPDNGINFCSNCGTRVTAGSKFCSQCGNQLF